MNAEISTHIAQEDQLAAYFAARPFQTVTHDDLVQEVGENYRSRISPLRKRGMVITNVRTFKADGSRGYGSYVYRPQALGRDAATRVPEPWESGTLFDLHPGPYQYQTRVTHG